MKYLRAWLVRLYHRSGIRYTIFISFTLTALLAIAITGVSFHARFSNQLESTLHSENMMIVEQANQSLDTYLRNMIRLSDTMSYFIVKNAEMPSAEVDAQLQVQYEANGDYVHSIAVFSATGETLGTGQPSLRREAVDVTEKDWFRRALEQTENLHFSIPSVQNIFLDRGTQYHWTIPLSSYTEITQNKAVRQGVLLINLRYNAITELFKNVSLANDGYIYLIDNEGTILYHPQHQLIASGLLEEENLSMANRAEGEYAHTVRGEPCSIIVRRVGYTGWSLIGVVPKRGLASSNMENILFILIMLLAYCALIVFINAFISNKLTDPIRSLELSVQNFALESDNSEICIGGSQEVQLLGQSIQQMVNQIKRLTNDIVKEQSLKQKSELNALQAQINPHFLYNTLDILVWMIEKNQPEEALKIVSALAKFFRLSLSKGKNVISVGNELDHVRNYLMIQQMRYKNKFTYTIDAQPGTQELATIKLVLQPIVENAIYHGMEFMVDGEGEITIRAQLRDGDLYLSVQDNGLGMPPEQVSNLLTENVPISMGSGIGLKNVHERITLYFGEAYGIQIESEPDEGTCITLHLPAVPYTEAEDNI